MRAPLCGLASLLVVGVVVAAAPAQHGYPGCPFPPGPHGPFVPGPYGPYLPGFYVRPNLNPIVPDPGPRLPSLPAQPFNGVLPVLNAGRFGPGQGPAFPTHPFARSPRDYFMYGQTTNDF